MWVGLGCLAVGAVLGYVLRAMMEEAGRNPHCLYYGDMSCNEECPAWEQCQVRKENWE